jgi:glycosyltransferase involved in cell wall biosynthesis
MHSVNRFEVLVLSVNECKNTVPVLHTLKLDDQNSKVLGTSKSIESMAYTRFTLKKAFSMSTAQRPRVLLLIPHLGGGGAERVIALLARDLCPEKYDLHLGLVTQTSASAASLPSWVRIHGLGASRVRAGAFKLLQLVRQVKPDVILSGMFHLNFLVLLLRPLFPRGTRILVRQNGTVSAALAFGGLPAPTRLLYRILYRFADRVVCQTPAMAEDLAEQLYLDPNRLVVLPNPVDVDPIRDAIDECPDLWAGPGPHLLAVGRLSPEKGFDLLLRALVIVRGQIVHTDLVIAGAGPDDAALKALRNELRLETCVRFVGHVDSPSAYFPGASAFVLSSRHEGLPNALLEAAAAGLPVIASPASQGVVDLLRGQPGTWLASEISADALASSLLKALKALWPGQRFDHPFIDEFRIDRAIRAYEELIDAVLVAQSKEIHS